MKAKIEGEAKDSAGAKCKAQLKPNPLKLRRIPKTNGPKTKPAVASVAQLRPGLLEEKLAGLVCGLAQLAVYTGPAACQLSLWTGPRF